MKQSLGESSLMGRFQQDILVFSADLNVGGFVQFRSTENRDMKGSSSGMTASALFYMAPTHVIFHRGMRTRGDLVLSLCGDIPVARCPWN